MITGNEMRDMGNRAIREMMAELRRQCADGASVNQACKDSITRVGVYRYVYNVGNHPDLYHRRFDGGGLADENNLVTRTRAGATTVSIEIEDQTPSNGDGVVNADPVTYLSDIIESGAHGRRWPDSDWPGARPYMEPSLQDGCSTGGRIDNAINAIFQNLILRA